MLICLTWTGLLALWVCVAGRRVFLRDMPVWAADTCWVSMRAHSSHIHAIVAAGADGGVWCGDAVHHYCVRQFPNWLVTAIGFQSVFCVHCLCVLLCTCAVALSALDTCHISSSSS